MILPETYAKNFEVRVKLGQDKTHPSAKPASSGKTPESEHRAGRAGVRSSDESQDVIPGSENDGLDGTAGLAAIVVRQSRVDYFSINLR